MKLWYVDCGKENANFFLISPRKGQFLAARLEPFWQNMLASVGGKQFSALFAPLIFFFNNLT